MSSKHYIYGLINPKTNQLFYIGQTHDPATRLKSHLSGRVNGFGLRRYLTYMKFGEVEPQMVILQTCDKKDVSKIEKSWIENALFHDAQIVNDKYSKPDGVEIRGEFQKAHETLKELTRVKKLNASIKKQVQRLIDRM